LTICATQTTGRASAVDLAPIGAVATPTISNRSRMKKTGGVQVD
jgi:hypothetical protein